MTDASLLTLLARRLNGTLTGDTLAVERDGVVVRVEATRTKTRWNLKLSSPLISATTGSETAYRGDARRRVAGRPDVVLRLETGGDRLGKRLRLNREIATGDARFDHDVYVHSHAPTETVREIVADERLRSATLALLERGWAEVRISGRDGQVQTAIDAPDGLVDLVEAAIPHVAEVAASLPLFEGDARWGARFIDHASPIIGFVVLLAGALLAVWGAHDFQTEDQGPIWRAALLGLAACPAVAVLAYFLARGRSEGLSTFGFCVLPMFIGLPAAAAGGLLVVNGKLDRGAEASHIVTIVKKETVRGSKQTKYYLHTSDYRSPPSSSPLELRVDRERYEAAREGGRLQMIFKPGRLGHRWLVDLRVAPPPP